MKLSYARILSKLQNLITGQVCMNALVGLCICMCVCMHVRPHVPTYLCLLCVCVYWGNLGAVTSLPASLCTLPIGVVERQSCLEGNVMCTEPPSNLPPVIITGNTLTEGSSINVTVNVTEQGSGGARHPPQVSCACTQVVMLVAVVAVNLSADSETTMFVLHLYIYIYISTS